MARAILEIDATTTGIAQAFGAIRAMARDTEREVKASMSGIFAGIPTGARAATGQVRREAVETGRVQERVARSTAQATEREAQRTVLAFVRGEEQRRRAAALTAANRERAERQATELARSEAQRRGLSAEQEARVRQTALERTTRVAEAEERRQTATAEREQRRRERAGRDIGYGLRRGLNIGGDAALNVARTAHSAIQDARRQRAESEHTLNAAFFQAGVAGPEAAQMRAQLESSLATGPLRGLSMGDVAGGIMAAQTQFSVLSGATPQERQANFSRQLELASFARSTFQDPAEVMRVAGMLGMQGVRGGDQQAVLRSLTGMAQAGSIELSTLTSTALGPLMANVTRVTNARQSPAQRAAAVQAAVSESMAVGELGAAAGLSPRDALNALAKMRSSTENPLVAERLDTRLRASGRADLADRLVSRDAQGRAGLRERDPVQLMSSLVSGMNGDANAVANLLSAGGRNAAMVLDSQQRRLILGMASQTVGGGTIAERVAQMQAAGTRFGAADVARGAALVEGEQRTEIQGAEERRLRSLNDGTDAVVRFSHALDNWARSHPVASSAVQTVGGLAGGVVGGALFPRIGAAIAATRVGALLTGAGGAAGGAAGGGAGVAAGGLGAAATAALVSAKAALLAPVAGLSAATAGAGLAAAGAGLAAGGAINRAMGNRQQSDNPLNAAFYTEFARSVRDAVRDGISSADISARVSPTDAAHAATVAGRR